MKDYFEFLNTHEFDIELTEVKSTQKNSIVELIFYKINEILFLMTLFYKKQIPKIFGFIENKNKSCLPEEYKENEKIDILKYHFNSKHLIFYQTKNCSELIGDYSNFWSERFTDIIEALFYSHVNISFKPSFNSIKLIIIGELKDENLYVYNFINNEKKKFVYQFHDILFILSFDYYYCRRNDGTRLVKIKLKIYFPIIYKYSSYFTFFIEKYINKYIMKKYDCNSIFRDILSKRQKFVFIYESKKKYNLNIFTTIIHQFFKNYEEILKSKCESALKNGSFDDKKKDKELSNTKIIIRIYDSENQLFDDLEIKTIKEFQNSSLYIEYDKFANNYDAKSSFY
jgi:hypothetical protein